MQSPWRVDLDGESLFAKHDTHGALPVTFLYVPVTHGVHSAPSRPAKPRLHVQCVECVELDGESLFAKHGAHGALPVTFLYVPDAHAPHKAPS